MPGDYYHALFIKFEILIQNIRGTVSIGLITMAQGITNDTIRNKWNDYKNMILPSSSHYQSLWDDWHKKFNIDKDNQYVQILR